MTITLEQFNKLVTKDEHRELAQKVDGMDKKIDQVLTSVDGLAKKVGDFQAELASNQAAHDRMQGDIVKIKERVGLRA